MTLGVIAASLARGVLGATLLVSARRKGVDLPAAKAAFARLGFRPDLVLTMVVVEGFTGLGLLVERRTAWAAYVATTLILALTAFVARQVVRGDDTPCACFGSGSSAAPTTAATLARNLGLLATAVVATGSTQTTGAGWKQLVLVLVAAVVTAGIIEARHRAG